MQDAGRDRLEEEVQAREGDGVVEAALDEDDAVWFDAVRSERSSELARRAERFPRGEGRDALWKMTVVERPIQPSTRTHGGRSDGRFDGAAEVVGGERDGEEGTVGMVGVVNERAGPGSGLLSVA